jgi:hypothetical protein
MYVITQRLSESEMNSFIYFSSSNRALLLPFFMIQRLGIFLVDIYSFQLAREFPQVLKCMRHLYYLYDAFNSSFFVNTISSTSLVVRHKENINWLLCIYQIDSFEINPMSREWMDFYLELVFQCSFATMTSANFLLSDPASFTHRIWSGVTTYIRRNSVSRNKRKTLQV